MDPLLNFDGAVLYWPDLQRFTRVLESESEPDGGDRLRYRLAIDRPDAPPATGTLEILLENQDALEGESGVDRANVVLKALTEWLRGRPDPAAPFHVVAAIQPKGAVTIR
jgi:hypothetical protein